MKRTNNHGVTLIELLVTISLIGILVGVSGDLLFTIFRSFNKASTIVNIQEEGNAIFNKIKTDAINAKSISITTTGSASTLSLTTDTSVIEYTITVGATEGGYTYGNLTRVAGAITENLFNTTSAKYKLIVTDSAGSNFYSAFTLKNSASTPKLLVIYLTVVPFNQDATTSKDLRIEGANATLRTSIVLRGSYDRIN